MQAAFDFCPFAIRARSGKLRTAFHRANAYPDERAKPLPDHVESGESGSPLPPPEL
jgi:hypothetical protein